MGMWFRRPDLSSVKNLPYKFWLKDAFTTLNASVYVFIRDDSKWDLRFWLSLPFIPLNYLLLPVLCTLKRKHAIKDIENNNGFTVANKSNAELFKKFNDYHHGIKTETE